MNTTLGGAGGSNSNSNNNIGSSSTIGVRGSGTHITANPNRRTNDQLTSFVRQATILRKNFIEYDTVLHTPQRGEDWMTMLGRYNAAYYQIVQVNTTIDDMMEHFVYVPQRATANPQDIPFFLSTRLETPSTVATTTTPATTTTSTISDIDGTTTAAMGTNHFHNTVQHLTDYETYAAQLVQQYEQTMVRF
jgi:hypothetical protein